MGRPPRPQKSLLSYVLFRKEGMSDESSEYEKQASKAKSLLELQAELLSLFEIQIAEVKELLYRHNMQRDEIKEKLRQL